MKLSIEVTKDTTVAELKLLEELMQKMQVLRTTVVTVPAQTEQKVEEVKAQVNMPVHMPAYVPPAQMLDEPKATQYQTQVPFVLPAPTQETQKDVSQPVQMPAFMPAYNPNVTRYGTVPPPTSTTAGTTQTSAPVPPAENAQVARIKKQQAKKNSSQLELPVTVPMSVPAMLTAEQAARAVSQVFHLPEPVFHPSERADSQFPLTTGMQVTASSRRKELDSFLYKTVMDTAIQYGLFTERDILSTHRGAVRSAVLQYEINKGLVLADGTESQPFAALPSINTQPEVHALH